jgi:hypothetical protein
MGGKIADGIIIIVYQDKFIATYEE